MYDPLVSSGEGVKTYQFNSKLPPIFANKNPEIKKHKFSPQIL
jgi:hypothetical protein